VQEQGLRPGRTSAFPRIDNGWTRGTHFWRSRAESPLWQGAFGPDPGSRSLRATCRALELAGSSRARCSAGRAVRPRGAGAARRTKRLPGRFPLVSSGVSPPSTRRAGQQGTVALDPSRAPAEGACSGSAPGPERYIQRITSAALRHAPARRPGGRSQGGSGRCRRAAARSRRPASPPPARRGARRPPAP